MLKTLCNSFSAGILISIGGSVFLSCDNRYVGAVFFSVALICICLKGYYLFTGKVGYIPQKHTRTDVLSLLVGLFGNALACVLCACLIKTAIPSIAASAASICASKLDTQALYGTFIRAIFCGILMYLAVSIYAEAKTPIGILFCVPVFILSGFEHSIADIFYFAVSESFYADCILFLLVVVAGNSVGGMLLPIISGIGDKKQ